MATYYTSDHHFGHNGIIRLARPEFASTESMEQHLIEAWNATVNPADTVFHLGDFSFKPALVPQIVERLHGRIHLIAGNHDPFWTGHSRPQRIQNAIQRYQRAGFASIHPTGQLLHAIDGHQVLLSHLPYYGDSQHDERYTAQRPQDQGLPILCGHVHRAWETLYGDGKTHRGQLHVGVDAWDYLPVEEGQVLDLLRTIRPYTFGGTA